MKRIVFGMTLAVVLTLCTVPQAQASSFLRINVDGTILTCDNTGGICGAGFTTALGSDSISFTGTINGVNFGGGGLVGLQLTGNSPGTPAIAFTLDSKTSLSNTSGVSHTITVDTGQNNFTLPTGSSFLSASQTANWTFSSAGDSQSFQSWLRNTNDFIIPTGTGTAISPNCVSAGGLTQSCNSASPDVAVVPTAPFAVTSREVIIMSAGSIASYTGTSAITPAPTQVPEPSSILLLGMGILMLAGLQWRTSRK